MRSAVVFALGIGCGFSVHGNSGTATDVPGWEAFGVGDSSSWVQIAEQSIASVPTGNWDMNLSGSSAVDPNFVGLSGIKTVAASRAAAAPGQKLTATVTYDNYFGPAGISYFIDWFDAGGSLLSSAGGALPDPNGPLTYAPNTQLLSITGTAPALTAKAGVRFQSANGGFAGAEADNFTLGAVPEPGSLALLLAGAMGMFGAVRRSGR